MNRKRPFSYSTKESGSSDIFAHFVERAKSYRCSNLSYVNI